MYTDATNAVTGAHNDEVLPLLLVVAAAKAVNPLMASLGSLGW